MSPWGHKDQPAYQIRVSLVLVDLASYFLAEGFASCRVGVRWFAIMGKVRKEDPMSIFKNITHLSAPGLG